MKHCFQVYVIPYYLISSKAQTIIVLAVLVIGHSDTEYYGIMIKYCSWSLGTSQIGILLAKPCAIMQMH